MNLRIPFLAAAGVLLSGCVVLGIEATFEDLALMSEEPADIVAQYSLPGRSAPSYPLIGMLRLDFAADIDLYEVMEDKGFMLAYDANICDSGIEIVSDPDIYENQTIPVDAQGKIHHYSVLLDSSWQGHDYDLERRPESFCVEVRAGILGSLYYYRSNTLVVDREQVIRAFEGGQ